MKLQRGNQAKSGLLDVNRYFENDEYPLCIDLFGHKLFSVCVCVSSRLLSLVFTRRVNTPAERSAANYKQHLDKSTVATCVCP